MDIPDFQKLLTKEWEVEIENTSLKLYYNEEIGDNKIRKITLLSETFTSRDWSPELTPHDLEWTGSKTFRNYCRGMPCSAFEILTDLGVTPDSKYTSDVLSRMQEVDLEVGNFNFSQMGKNLKHYILLHMASKVQLMAYKKGESEKAKLDTYETNISDEEVAGLLELGETGIGVDLTMLDWAEEVQEFDDRKNTGNAFLESMKLDERDTTDVQSMDEELEDVQWQSDTKAIESMAEMFFELDMDEYNLSEQDFETIIQMPVENQYWLDVTTMSKSETSGQEILESICRGVKVNEDSFLISHCAFFVSLAARENVYSKHRKPPSSQLEQSISMSTRDPMVAKEDIDHHLEDLRRKLSEINESMKICQGYVREILSKKRDELLAQIEAYDNNADEVYTDEINYYEFMDRLIRELKEKKIWDKTDQSSELEVLATLLISDVIESTIEKNRVKMISDLDLNSVRSRIWDRVFSGVLVRHIANAFSLSIEVWKGDKSLYCHVPRLSLDDIDLKFD
jgi:hypothetical protein